MFRSVSPPKITVPDLIGREYSSQIVFNAEPNKKFHVYTTDLIQNGDTLTQLQDQNSDGSHISNIHLNQEVITTDAVGVARPTFTVWPSETEGDAAIIIKPDTADADRDGHTITSLTGVRIHFTKGHVAVSDGPAPTPLDTGGGLNMAVISMGLLAIIGLGAVALLLRKKYQRLF